MIETELLNEIAARSDSFFEAATTLQELRICIINTVSQIKRLRNSIQEVDRGVCDTALYVQKKVKRRDKINKTIETLQVN